MGRRWPGRDVEAEGREVMTVEALGDVDSLHPIQEAVYTSDGAQCGFCTSGFLIATKALLDRNPDPTTEDVRAGLAGNLCRCNAYGRIIEAVLAAAERVREGDSHG